jgi:hypothetical protein
MLDKEKQKEWFKRNSLKIKMYRENYYQENKIEINKKSLKVYKINKKKYPWKYTLRSIKTRCNNNNVPEYKNYGGRGIKCLITADELKELWFRDNASQMKKPSIDRIDNNGDYCLENCRFIELKENTKKAQKNKRKIILQFTKDGQLVKEWESILSINKSLKIAQASIISCCKNLRKSAGGYIFKYKEN